MSDLLPTRATPSEPVPGTSSDATRQRTRARNTPTGRAGVFLLFSITVALSVATATDPDLWWHLRTGELILAAGIPSGDVFSFTVPGRDWITHEWGSQVLMWLLWQVGGAPALIVAFTALIVATYVLAHMTSRARPLVTASVVVLAAATARIATAPRPQMLNLFGLVLVVFVLERIRAGRLDARLLWAIPAVIAVWANLHSGYLLGVVVVAVYAIGERFERRRPGGRPLSDAVVGRLPVVAALSFAAAALNPNGLAIWRYPFDTLRSDAMRTYIREWHSPDFHSPWFWPFAAMLGVTVIAIAASRRSPGVTQCLLVGGTAFAGLQSMRHIPLFAVVAIPVVAEQLEILLDARRVRRSESLGSGSARQGSASLRTSRPIAALTVALGVVVMVMFFGAVIANNDRAVAELYPVDAVDALVDAGLDDEPGFNAYGWGGYLIWRDLPVFIDGRADVYGDEFMTYYFSAEDATAGWRAPLDDLDVQWVLLAPDADLGVVLAETDDWTSVYDDGVAEIFYRCAAPSNCPRVG